MQMFMVKRNKALLQKLEEYIDTAGKALEHYYGSMEHFFQHGNDAAFEVMVKETHKVESDADDLLQEIEQSLYEKSLLPDSREDLFTLIEKTDCLPNKGESILRQLYTQNISLPDSLKPQIWKLIKLGADTFQIIREAFLDAFAKMKRIKALVRDIDTNESLGDQLEQEILFNLFRSDVDPIERLMIRDIILEIGRILDLSEDIGDTLNIFAIKRRV